MKKLKLWETPTNYYDEDGIQYENLQEAVTEKLEQMIRLDDKEIEKLSKKDDYRPCILFPADDIEESGESETIWLLTSIESINELKGMVN